MPLEFITSQRGKDKLLADGYLYVKEKTKNEITYWKCDKLRSLHCRARLHTCGQEIVSFVAEHSHLGDAAAIEVAKALNKAKQRAKETNDDLHQIATNSFKNLPSEATGRLPRPDVVKRSLRNIRHKENGFPIDPASLRALNIPDEYKKTRNGKPFLLFDSGDVNDRILIFSTRENLRLLALSDKWYADGAFKTVPSLFGQLYTIHGIANNDVIPAVFVLLPRRTEDVYLEFFNQLKQLKPNLIPERIMTDFDIPANNALQQVFPTTNQRGSHFHFKQCLYRNIQHNGLKRLYDTDASFALQMRMLAALAFVPVSDVVKAFDYMIDNIDFPPEANPVIDYFENTWIGPTDHHLNRQAPKFGHEMWNCYNGVMSGLPKTNNACEVWHRKFAELTENHHPTIWKFLTALQEEQGFNERRIEQFLAGETLMPSTKRYRDCGPKIVRTVSGYGSSSIGRYLQSVAENCVF